MRYEVGPCEALNCNYLLFFKILIEVGGPKVLSPIDHWLLRSCTKRSSLSRWRMPGVTPTTTRWAAPTSLSSCRKKKSRTESVPEFLPPAPGMPSPWPPNQRKASERVSQDPRKVKLREWASRRWKVEQSFVFLCAACSLGQQLCVKTLCCPDDWILIKILLFWEKLLIMVLSTDGISRLLKDLFTVDCAVSFFPL